MLASSTEFRRMIQLLEEADTRSLDEGPVSRLANKALGALGNKRAAGRVERDELSKPMLDGFKNWLGRTERKGTEADISTYLGHIGFQQPEISVILGHEVDAGNTGDAEQTANSDSETTASNAAPNTASTTNSSAAAPAATSSTTAAPNTANVAAPGAATSPPAAPNTPPNSSATPAPAAANQTNPEQNAAPDPIVQPAGSAATTDTQDVPPGTASTDQAQSGQAATPQPSDQSANTRRPVSGAPPRPHADVPTPELQQMQQNASDRMNRHDELGRRAAKRYDAAVANNEPQARIDHHKAVVNRHRNSYRNASSDHGQHTSELDSRQPQAEPATGQPENLAASRRYPGNRLMELNVAAKLSRSKISDIFTKASAYAFDNHSNLRNIPRMVGSGGGGTSSQQQGQSASTGNNSGQASGNYGGYNTSNQNNQSQTNSGGDGGGGNWNNNGSNSANRDQGSNQQQSSAFNVKKVIELAKKEGLTDDAISDLSSRAKPASSAGQMGSIADKKALAILGFAFLKVLG